MSLFISVLINGHPVRVRKSNIIGYVIPKQGDVDVFFKNKIMGILQYADQVSHIYEG